MNFRKIIDYSAMYAMLDKLMAADLPQVRLYYEIGQLVGNRPEKGAAVAASKYLCNSYSDVSGFSPRNLRRMREFYYAYRANPELLAKAMTIGWTQNIAILEAELTLPEKVWYIQAVQKFGWSKLILMEKIESEAHTEGSDDFQSEVCCAGENRTNNERSAEYMLYLWCRFYQQTSFANKVCGLPRCRSS